MDDGDPESFGGYRSVVESRMLGSAEAVDGLVAKQLKRGWYVGGEQFREWLAKRLPEHSDNLRGEQRRAHDEHEAERLMAAGLVVAGITEPELLAMKNTCPEKQALAWLLKKFTTATGVWIASRLNMGHRSNVTRALQALERAPDRDRQLLKEKMMQCTG